MGMRRGRSTMPAGRERALLPRRAARDRGIRVWLIAAMLVVWAGPATVAAPLDCTLAPEERCEAWVRVHDNVEGHDVAALHRWAGADELHALEMATAGDRLYATGTSNSPAGWIGRTMAIDPGDGNAIWTAEYAGPTTTYLIPYDLAISADGSRLYLTGEEGVYPYDSDFVTLAYDASTGAQLWRHAYDGPKAYPSAQDYEAGWSVAPSPDGNLIYVLGRSSRRGTGLDHVTLALDAATGDRLWERRYHSGKHLYDQGVDLHVARDEASPHRTRLYVVGYSDGQGSNWDRDHLIVAYDGETGEELWVSRFDSPGAAIGLSHDLTRDSVLSGDGTRLYVTGLDGTNRSNYLTVAYDTSDGRVAWEHRWRPAEAGHNTSHAVSLSPDDERVYVTGGAQPEGGWFGYGTLAYDADTGDLLWAATLRTDSPAKAVVPSDDGVYVTGLASGLTGGLDYATVAYDAGTGTQEWVARYNSAPGGVDTDMAKAAMLAPDGRRLFVGGTFWYPQQQGWSLQTRPGNGADFGLVAYDLDGS